MYHIALVGKPNPMRFRLRQILDQNMDFQVMVFSHPDQLVDGFGHFKYSAIVMALSHLREKNFYHLKYASENTQKIPVIFVAPHLGFSMRKKLAQFNIQNISVLDGRTEVRDLNSILIKLVDGQSNFSRLHPRYLTSEVAQVVSDNHQISSARMINLSFSGAQLEIKNKHLYPNQPVFIQFHRLQKPVRQLLAQVKWVDIQSKRVGVEFISEKRHDRPLFLLENRR